ncbi:outer membrane protein assembly factor BamB family protein [Natrialba asiatica]|uniref:Pyrrolo-quinoline quinone repeat domain-containing protein n=1 Tax=Natrialba asiatica (strain ATCC 700177 / DSM 12278 / JCM 9576 / FERM P-10747 / NBRC 102637 / 172P1) TaxID=29540 RepID=M0ASR9_NATA1|nr:PQQ-binding-like beta-propeller repeat protein [Natrialba asiatica]ELZ00424.1 hypothetical protein C481_12279 [Natrialba asiatica DSM 12278]
MKNAVENVSRRAVLAGVGSLLGAGCLGAERTPGTSDTDWRMYGCDPGRTRFVPNASLPRDGVDIAWERSVSASGWYPPVVANETVYCQYSNGLFVLDAATGEGTRASTYGPFGRDISPMAFASTELYRDGVLVVPYGTVIGGYAAGRDGWPDSVSGIGEERARWWLDGDSTSASRLPLRASDGEWLGSPLTVDGTLVSLHPRSATLSASDSDDGSNRWRFDLETVAADGYVASPVGHVVDTTTGTVVVKLRTRREESAIAVPLLVGISSENGSLEWRTTTGEVSSGDTNPGVEPADSLTTRDGTVYTIDWDTSSRALRLRELDAATGELGWTKSLDRSEHIGVAVDEARLYHVGLVDREGAPETFRIVALDRNSGSRRWVETIDGAPVVPRLPYGAPPTVADEHLLVPGRRGLHALDRGTGETLWTFTEMAPTSGGGSVERSGMTPAVVTDDRIVIGTTLMLYGLE